MENIQVSGENFEFFDYVMIDSPTGKKAANLREFLNLLEEMPDNVIFHHIFQSQLKYHSKIFDFNGDFANWASEALEDYILAEKLGNFNPYNFETVSSAKAELVEIIEEHMWNLPNIPWARPGFEFYFSYSTTVIIPSGVIVRNIRELRSAIKKINSNSLYYHFCETRKIRKQKDDDDFSVWIGQNFERPEIVEKIREIDFYFFSIDEIRKILLKILSKEQP